MRACRHLRVQPALSIGDRSGIWSHGEADSVVGAVENRVKALQNCRANDEVLRPEERKRTAAGQLNGETDDVSRADLSAYCLLEDSVLPSSLRLRTKIQRHHLRTGTKSVACQ